jgi:hypothetical protein
MSRARTESGMSALFFGAARAIPRGRSRRDVSMSSRGDKSPRNLRHASLVGIDLAPEFRIPPRKSVVVALVACIVAALMIAGLRIDLLRKSYASAAAVSEEQTLEEEKQRLLVKMRALRDPADLVAHAQKLGFGHPERVIDLDESRHPDAPAAVGARP